MPADPLLSVRNLTCQRGGRLVFQNICFDVWPGTALMVTGPNGVGKTSLLRLLAGLGTPATGAITRDTQPALLGTENGLKPYLTIAEELDFWQQLRGGLAGQTALTAIGIGHLAQLPCRFLSAGQRRRVALARVIASGAKLWLLDEPTGALDEQAIELFEVTLQAHLSAGGAAVVATHVPIRARPQQSLAL